MDTKILPVVPQESVQEKWKEEAVVSFRKARVTRSYENLRECIRAMHKAFKILKSPRDEPLFMEIAKFLKSIAQTLPNKEYNQGETFLLFYFIGDLLSECRDYEYTHYCLDKALQMNPNDEDVYYSKAWAYKETNDRDKSIEYFEKTVSLNPAHIRAWRMLGYLYRLSNKFSKAKQCYERYLLFTGDENPDEKELYDIVRKWIPYLNRKIELFGEELRYL
jgi:tetratricopeptide (TPR) repeat protein